MAEPPNPERFSTVSLGADEPKPGDEGVPTPAGPDVVTSAATGTAADKPGQIRTMSTVSDNIFNMMEENTAGEINISLNHDIYNGMLLLIVSGVWDRKLKLSQKVSMAVLTFGTMIIQMASILVMYWHHTHYPGVNTEKASDQTPFAVRCLGMASLLGNVGQMFREGVVFYNLCIHFPDMSNEHMTYFGLLYAYNATLFFYTVSMVQKLIQWQEDSVDALLQVVAVHFINEIDDYMLASLASPVSLYLSDDVFDESFTVEVKESDELNVFGHLLGNEAYIAINQGIMMFFICMAFYGLDKANDIDQYLPSLRDCVATMLVSVPVILALAQRKDETPRLKMGFYFMIFAYCVLFLWMILIIAGVSN